MWVNVTIRGEEEESHSLCAQQKNKVLSLEHETIRTPEVPHRIRVKYVHPI